MRAITRRAVFAGRVITERRPFVARVRNPVFRALSANKRLNRLFQDKVWVPEPQYAAGLQAAPRNRASGCLIPQPWVTEASGERIRLDDAVGRRWLLLHAGTATAQPAWSGLGIESVIVTAMAGALGIIVAHALFSLLYARIIAGIGVSYISPPATEIATILLASMAATVFTGIVAAYWPARVASRMEPYDALRRDR